MTVTTLVPRPSDWAPNVRISPPGGRGTTLPLLSNFTRHYGVRVSDIGEDGDMIALGHVGKLRALAVFNRHARTVWGEIVTPASAALRVSWHRPPLVRFVEHRWMVNDGDAQDWRLKTVQGRTVSGAFPVTYWVA
jgi:hypothetical protein